MTIPTFDQLRKNAAALVGKLSKRQRIGFLLLAVIVIGLLILLLQPPDRTVANYCRAYEDQETQFSHGGDQEYRAGVFTSSVNDPGKFAEAYAALERVAPDEIRYDVRTLRSTLETMDENPSQMFGAALSGLGAEMRVTDWTKAHCRPPIDTTAR